MPPTLDFKAALGIVISKIKPLAGDERLLGLPFRDILRNIQFLIMNAKTGISQLQRYRA